MEISIGDELHGRDGSLGKVDRFLIDPRTDTIEHIVVNPGVFRDERIIPLDQLQSMGDGAIGVDLGNDEFKELELYHESIYHAGYRHDSGPPAYGNTPADRTDYLMDETMALGAQGFTTGKTMGYPGGEQTVPDDKQFPSVAHGTDIVDVDGEKVGTIGSFAIDASRGVPTRFTMRRGLILTN